MKSITIVSPNYHPESNAGAKRTTAVAQHLAKSGWQVSVVTNLPHHPQNELYAGFDLSSPDVRTEEGVVLVRLRPWLVPKANFAARLLSESLFTLKAARELLKRRADVIWVSSPYMFLAPLGLFMSRLKGSLFALDIRDLIWHYPKAAGKRTYGLDTLFDTLMRATVGRADIFTATTEAQLNYFRSRPLLSKAIPNGVSDEVLEQLADVAKTPPFQGEQLIVLYAGLFGYNHDLSVLLQAAERLPEISFTLIGDGPERPKLERWVKEKALGNIRFKGYMPFTELAKEYCRADILVSHVRQHSVFRFVQAAKVWEYMATGRATIHAGEGESVAVIEGCDCGLAVPSGDPDALAGAIRFLQQNPEEAQRLASRGRMFVETERRRSTLSDALAQLLDEAVNAQPPSSP